MVISLVLHPSTSISPRAVIMGSVVSPSKTSNVPLISQLLASVIVYGWFSPAETPVKIPVVFDVSLKVYVIVPVPPLAKRVTSAVPPEQLIFEVTDALSTTICVGTLISKGKGGLFWIPSLSVTNNVAVYGCVPV